MNKNDDILMDGIDERVEAFLRGEMSEEEEAIFKQEIRSNPELRNRAMAMTSLLRGLQTKNTAKEKAIVKEVTTKSRVRPILWWVTSIAAVLAIFFGIYNMNDVSRGDLDSATIAHLYDLFTQIQESRSVSDIIKELEPIYKSLDDNFTYNAYANDISWNLALAYVKNDQTDKAIPILEKLKKDNPDTPIYSRADELINKLQDL